MGGINRFLHLKKPPFILDENMPIYSPTGFLDITNATLRTSNTECQNLQIGSGNVYVTTDLTSNLVLNLENITNLGATTSNTVVFSNVTTGLTVSSNIVATGNVTAGSFLGNGSGLTNIPPSAITGTLSQWSDGTNSDVYIASNVGIGNVHTLTSNTLQVGANLYVRDADANVLTVTGNVAATRFVGDGSLLTGIASNLHQVVENGNVTSNTVQFTNATTGFITTSNVEIGGTLKINTISAAAYQSLQSVTDVSNSTSNTVQFTNATTSFTTTSNIDVGGRINMGGHMIPTADNTYDIGSAAFKIRDMYVSDNSLWIGDEAKISFTGNQLKFRRRKKSVVPSGLTTLGAAHSKDAATVQSEALASASGVSTVADMKLHHWMAYAKSLDTTKTTGDIFTDSADDYEASAASEAFKEVGDDIYSAHNVSIGKSTAPTTALDVNGTVTATAFVGAMPNLDAAKITTGTLDRNTTGSAAKLTATVAIGGVSFDGSADIVPTTFGGATFSGDVAFNTNTLKIDSTTNRVGIGTASPLETCDIHGVSRISAAYPKLEFYRTPRPGSDTWGNDTDPAGDYRIHANGDASDGTKRSLNFDYGQNSVHTSRMVINAAGNVGIGTTSPDYKLDVNGTLGQNGKEIYAQRRWEIDLTAQSNVIFYPIEFKHQTPAGVSAASGSPQYPPVHFKVFGDSLSAADPYNENTLVGYAKGGGYSDHGPMYDVHVERHHATEHRFQGLYEGNSSYSHGFVIYMRGGYRYSTLTDASEVVTHTTTFDMTTTEFALKNVSGADVSGTSLNITQLVNIAGASGEQRWMSGSLNIPGNVGIGTTSPEEKLHVSGQIRMVSQRGIGGTYNSILSWPNSGHHIDCYINTSGHIFHINHYAQQSVYLNRSAYSDRRIKEDIKDIDDVSALNTLRQIKPKTYKYKLQPHKGTVYGFIAQDVREVLPYATNLTKLSAPFDREKFVNATILEDGTVNLDGPCNELEIGKNAYFYYESSTSTRDFEVTEIISPTQFSVRVGDGGSEWIGNTILVGKEVNDFHGIDKDAIFTVATAALQEVDRQLQAEKAKVTTLESQLASVLTRLDALENA